MRFRRASTKHANPLVTSILLGLVGVGLVVAGLFTFTNASALEDMRSRSQVVDAQVVGSRSQSHGSGKNRRTDYYVTVELIQGGQPGGRREFEVSHSVYKSYWRGSEANPIPARAVVDLVYKGEWMLEDDLDHQASTGSTFGWVLPLAGLGLLAAAFFSFKKWRHDQQMLIRYSGPHYNPAPGYPQPPAYANAQQDYPPPKAQGYPPQPPNYP